MDANPARISGSRQVSACSHHPVTCPPPACPNRRFSVNYRNTILGSVLSASLAVGLVACGSPGSTDAVSGGTPTTVAKPKANSPESCLSEPATLTAIEFRGGDGGAAGYKTWRGEFSNSQMVVLVEEMESPAAARKAVRQATDVIAAAGGRFFVHGPSKGAVPAPGDSERSHPTRSTRSLSA